MHELLQQILVGTKERVEAAKAAVPFEHLERNVSPSVKSFVHPLEGGRAAHKVRLIAEWKRKSPSRGTLVKSEDFERYLELYAEYADAVSVLTNYPEFGGSLEDLFEARETMHLPLLRKDFVVDEYQILEARQFGANAVLLIARILTDEQLLAYRLRAEDLGMTALVEVHSEVELARAISAGAKVIGVNSRDLDTLQMDTAKMEGLLRDIPESVVAIAESGINSAADVERLRGLADAMLVGTSILASEDPEGKLRELTGR